MSLTVRGRGVLAAAAGLLVAAKLFGSVELAGLGSAAGAALTAGAVLVGRAPMSYRVERWLAPTRVAVGGTAQARLRFTNTERRSATRRAVAMDGEIGAVVPALAPGAMAEASYELPTVQRGLFSVGPLVVGVSDLFGLVERRIEAAGTGRLVVHPRVHPVLAPPGSPSRDARHGRTSPTRSPRGDDFFALREYEVGDDLRRVHWRSTARLGELMLRQDEQRFAEVATVLLDTRASAHGTDSFERALEVAASIAGALVEDGRRLRFITTGGFDVEFDGARVPGGRGEGQWAAVLDYLARVAPDGGVAAEVDRFALAVQAIRHDGSGPLVAVVGHAVPAELAALGSLRSRLGLVMVAECASHEPPNGTAAGALVVQVGEAGDFAAAWNAAVLLGGPGRRASRARAPMTADQ